MGRWADRIRLRMRSLLHGRTADVELARELRDHIEQQILENLEAGMNPGDARAAAHRAFGSIPSIEEQCRDTRRVAWIENLCRDLRYTFHALLRQPMLVLASTLSIAIGVGANTAVFRLATELLLTAPTAHDPGRLVHIRMGTGSHISYQQWRDLEASGALAGVAGYQIEQEVNWQAADHAVTLVPLIVTANFFDVLGVPVARGTPFGTVEADAERDPRMAVISHQFWQRQLGGDPSVVGRTIVINGEPYTIRGVLPSTLRAFPGFGVAPQVYLPISRAVQPDLHDVRSAAVQLVGRLRPDQEPGAARAALQAAASALAPGYGMKEFARVDQFTPVSDGPRDFQGVTAFFTLLLVVVGFVLAIACANVTGLLLARNAARSREIAVRLALGAGRGRLLQQLLAEGFWLSLVGTLTGLALASVILGALASVPLPLPLPLELNTSPDPRLLGYSAALLVATTFMSTAIPALQATRPTLSPMLKHGESRPVRRRRSTRAALVVGQVAISSVLLVTALLFLRNLARTNGVDPGFDTNHTLSVAIGFVEGRHTREVRLSLLAAAVERVRSLPGVEGAAVARGVPLTLRSGRTTGGPARLAAGQTFHVQYEENMVGPGYFQTMDVPFMAGRDFTAADGAGRAVPTVVNEEFARRYLGGAPAVGATILLPGADEPYEVLGVVRNSKHRMLGESQQAAIYTPFARQRSIGRFAHVLVRAGDADSTLPLVRAAVGALDPAMAVEVVTMREALAFAFLPSRVGAWLLGTLGALGLLLAAGGLFAMMSFSVARRRREIAVRLALGASRAAVLRLVGGESMVLLIVGLAIGLGAAFWLTGPVSMFLVAGLSARDLVSFGGTALLFGMVGVGATVLPVRRALQTEPAVALRDE